MTRKSRWVLSACLAALATTAVALSARAADPADRLDRFRELAASRLALVQVLDPENPAEAYREIYALLDDEILDSLGSGGVFASPEFLQDRLDGFAEAWGGASLKLVRAGRLVVGAFQLGDGAAGNTVRVYGDVRGESGLLAAMSREGRPVVHPLPAAAGSARFLVAWEGSPSGRGTRALRIDLVGQAGDDLRVAWSTADIFGDRLLARAWSVRGPEVRIRYELHYPGWAPGCAGQTEQEDVYRLTAAGGVTRAARRQHDGWHRELHAVVARLFDALGAGDAAALAALVPDRGLRARLPAGLRAEPACDGREGPGGEAVSVAAVAERAPWALTFRRAGTAWRLTAAAPVLP